MPGPATKLGSLTGHGGTVIGPGCPTVLIENTPAIRVGVDMHVCPMVTPVTPPIPHGGMNNLGPGVPSVLMGGFPSSTVGDMFMCAGAPPAPVVIGATTVFIGTGGAGGGGGGGSDSPQAKAEAKLKAGTISPVKGTETYPIEIQAIALVLQKYCTPEGQQLDMAVIEALAQEHERKKDEDELYKDLTIADFVDILKNLEQRDGYETARHFAGYLNYEVLCEMAKAFVSGENTDRKNDPNQMPTRYMILYGADDKKLQEISAHPDKSEKEEHKITVANLRKALILQGAKIAETGPYDESVFNAYWNYFFRFMKDVRVGPTHAVAKGEDLGKIARMFMLSSWKYLYECNKEVIGDNPDLLAEGTELNIPQWDSTQGDEMITEKGGKAETYVGGLIWRYPWQTKSVSFMDEIKDGLMADFNDERDFRIVAVSTGETVVSGTIKKSDEVDVLIPDMVETKEEVDGLIIRQ